MITLIIKGTIQEAFAAADKHGIELTSIVPHARWAECICTTNAPSHLVAQWFGEFNGEPPYPPGSVTWYGEKGV